VATVGRFLDKEIIVHNAKSLNTSRRVGMAGQHIVGVSSKLIPTPHQPIDSETEVLHALEEISDIVSDGCFAHPDTLTQDGITAYALSLIRVRECAGMAGMERLMRACDALAITVSRLIDDRASASLANCKALTQFVAHARAMIVTSPSRTAKFASPSSSRTKAMGLFRTNDGKRIRPLIPKHK
jgi:alpha-D-ribose 1-methylphosphonate 5-phosphate C-P lyase